MKVNQAPFVRPKTQFQPAQTQAASSFGPEIDPIGDLVDGVEDFLFETAWVGSNAVLGATPVVGAYTGFEAGFMGGMFGGNSANARLAMGAAGVNAIGSVGLGVAAVQALVGADPTAALTFSAAALAGSGIMMGIHAYAR